MKKIIAAIVAASSLFAGQSFADERLFTYIYEADVLPKGGFELEQYVTNQNGRRNDSYSQWNYRTEFEYGVTEHYQTSLYVNYDSTHSSADDVHETEYKSFSWENVYQILNPNLDPIGLAAYLEYSHGNDEDEVEYKILASKPIGDWNLAANLVYETEWEQEGASREKEATMEFLAGASYKLAPNWSIGVESRNKAAYPGGFNLSGQEYNTWAIGPNIHYGTPTWWATLTALPQVWGNGDGSIGGRQLVHEEEVEVRLIVGMNF